MVDTSETKYSSMCGFWKGLDGAHSGWGKWWRNITINDAGMPIPYVKYSSRWGETNAAAEREREREIMVCMIIFVTAEGNQLSGWMWWGWLWLHNLREGWAQSEVSVTWYVAFDIMITFSIQGSWYCWGTDQWLMAEFGAMSHGDFYISFVVTQAVHCLNQ